MDISSFLLKLLSSGFDTIGEIRIQSDLSSNTFCLTHHLDFETSLLEQHGGLTPSTDPNSARTLTTYSTSGEYRFLKAAPNIQQGWILKLNGIAELRLALDLIYPGCIGLFLAQQNQSLRTLDLRDKLNRQTGMYRSARQITTEAAQALVQSCCDPSCHCLRKILWNIDSTTPLCPSPTREANGHHPHANPARSIPLLCPEPCNHLVAQCKIQVKSQQRP